MSGSCRLLYVVNNANFFLTHRLSLARAARDSGYEVHVAAPHDAGPRQAMEIERFTFHALPMTRRGMNPVQELCTMWKLYCLYRGVRPDIVHHVTIKPVLYGGIVARLARVGATVNAISGLGYVFITKGLRAALLRAVVKLAYRLALGHRNSRTIFQNSDDMTLFVGSRLIRHDRAVLVRGSGADLGYYEPSPERPGVPMVLFAGRLLKDKGLMEYVEAARRIRERGVDVRIVVAGAIDAGNPSSIAPHELAEWEHDGIVEYIGQRQDMPSLMAQAHIVCLPSYREGLPRVLIEAAACGRAIVATDVPGCREVVCQGVNGLLVPPRDAASLADAIQRLVESPSLRRLMGAEGRKLARGFSEEQVVRETLALYTALRP